MILYKFKHQRVRYDEMDNLGVLIFSIFWGQILAILGKNSEQGVFWT